jgi:hypothetical protein
LLRQARDGGAILLADIGLTALSVPANDARAFDLPPSIRDATAAEIDAEPTVLNFLSEAAIRRGDLNSGVGYQERALDRNGDVAGGTRLALAQAIFRRETASTHPSAREHRRAVTHAQAAVEGRRRWHGPSAEALAWLLRIYIITGELNEVVRVVQRHDQLQAPGADRVGVQAQQVQPGAGYHRQPAAGTNLTGKIHDVHERRAWHWPIKALSLRTSRYGRWLHLN